MRQQTNSQGANRRAAEGQPGAGGLMAKTTCSVAQGAREGNLHAAKSPAPSRNAPPHQRAQHARQQLPGLVCRRWAAAARQRVDHAPPGHRICWR